MNRTVFGLLLLLSLTPIINPPLALALGIGYALVASSPIPHKSKKIAGWSLQLSVVLLGFGMQFMAVLQAGLNGAWLAIASISATLAFGWWLGGRLQVPNNIAALISAGTAICGGSAIAAVGGVIGAASTEMAISLATVFVLNAVALYLFPLLGHLLQLTPVQFGTWAGIAIHDISAVVSAGIRFGDPQAEQVAIAVKLARTIWIVPVALAAAWLWRQRHTATKKHSRSFKVPWFIGFFGLATLIRSVFPATEAIVPYTSAIATAGLSGTLFLLGSNLSVRTIRNVGWRPFVLAGALWVFISVATFVAIRCGA
ncbi:MAG: putative sulfate exporter family transporter [Verrucomicrobia bacterium]|nr:putative sulfate exporter family transporter [Verrucomicrobiota bacterium]